MSCHAVGVTASPYQGAAHQLPQVFQIVVAKHTPGLLCGCICASFLTRRNVASIPIKWLKGSRCSLAVSTVEATVFELVGHMRHGTGSLDRVSGMVCELAEETNPKFLVEAARFPPTVWAQCLGYLLEYAEAEDKAALLKEHVRRRAKNHTRLVPYGSAAGTARSEDWKVIVNRSIDMEA